MTSHSDVPYAILGEPMKMMSSDSSDSSGEGGTSVNTGYYTSEDEGRILILPPQSPPKDKFNLVYIAIYLLGISSLLPWNFFITVTQYFNYKYRNTSLPLNMSSDARYETHLQVTFESDLALANQIPSVVLQISMIFFLRRFSAKSRLVTSIVLTFLMFALTTVLVKVDTDSWQGTFFAVTLASVVVLSGASSVTTSSLFGLTATLPPRYTQAIMGGMGLGGVVSAVANILTLAVGGDVVESAFWYFIIAECFVLASLVGYFFMERTVFATYYREEFNRVLVETSSKKHAMEGASAGAAGSKARHYLSILKQVVVWGFSVTLVFLVTLAIFPSITANVHSVNEQSKSMWATTYFLPLYCFLLFNVGDLVGRTVAGWYILPKPGVTIPMLSIMRIAFIPLFMVCNVLPRHGQLKLVLDNDVYPVVLMALFSLTNGYISTVSMMLGPRSVNKDQAETAGTVMSFMMTAGLTLGSSLSYLLIEVV